MTNPDAETSQDSGNVNVGDLGVENDAETGYCPQSEIAMEMTIGRCTVAGTGDDCTGADGETQVFVPLMEGETMRIVTGFQGTTMLNFAIRTSGVDPGVANDPTSDENPLVEVRVHRTTYSVVGRFRGRVPLETDPDDTDSLLGMDLFVLLGAAVPVGSGQTLMAVVTVDDQDGVEQCGQVEFIVN